MMEPLFEDGTHELLPHDNPFYMCFELFLVAYFYAGYIAGLNFLRLAIEEQNLVNFCVLFPFLLGGCWMLSQVTWRAFFFPRRIHFIFGTTENNSLLICRDYPCKPVAIGKDAKVRYNIAPGFFTLDLKFRSNAPVGLNLWFECQGKQFWLSEASPNYRDALYLLAGHAQLRHDTSLHSLERYTFWLLWRAQFKDRPHLHEVIEEIHRILRREQLPPPQKPLVIATASQEISAIAPDVPPHQPDSPLWNDEPQTTVGIEPSPTAEPPRQFGDTRLVMNDGRATLIVRRQKRAKEAE
jgi:hypothetical protein